MKLGVAALVLLVAGWLPRVVHADAPHPYLPSSLYPPGSLLTFDAAFSNASMNAAWNKDANGDALMHTYGEDVFLRQSGWMERSFLVKGRRIAWFILFASRYGAYSDGTAANAVAFHDLHTMLKVWWHAHAARSAPTNLVPAGTTGGQDTQIIPKLGDGPFVVMSAWWGATQEVEGIAFSSPGLLSRTTMLKMLGAQVRAVEHLDPT